MSTYFILDEIDGTVVRTGFSSSFAAWEYAKETATPGRPLLICEAYRRVSAETRIETTSVLYPTKVMPHLEQHEPAND